MKNTIFYLPEDLYKYRLLVKKLSKNDFKTRLLITKKIQAPNQAAAAFSVFGSPLLKR